MHAVKAHLPQATTRQHPPAGHRGTPRHNARSPPAPAPPPATGCLSLAATTTAFGPSCSSELVGLKQTLLFFLLHCKGPQNT